MVFEFKCNSDEKNGKYCSQIFVGHTSSVGAQGLLIQGVPPIFREAPVRFGSVTVWRWNGSSGSGFWFRRFLCKKGFSAFQYSLTGKDGSGSGFGSWKTAPAVPVPPSVSGKTVPTVPVSGSGSVPEPPCIFQVHNVPNIAILFKIITCMGSSDFISIICDMPIGVPNCMESSAGMSELDLM